MKVAIVGAGGFIGQEVTRQLCADKNLERLTLVDVTKFAHPHDSRIHVINGDFASPEIRNEVFPQVDKVIFLASILGGSAERNYALARKVNIDGTLDVIEHLRDTAPETRFVFASTIATYAQPLPDLVTDDTPLGPSMVYGAQKLMIEVALANFATKGWLDAVSIRPAGVVARDGTTAALKTAFMSRLFWCVKRGEDITLPVSEDSRTWLSSVKNVSQNFIHAATLPEIGATRAFTLPALSLTFGELTRALKQQFPETASKVTFAPDEEIISLFGSYPRLITETADRLGFSRDTDATALIRNALNRQADK